MIDENDIDPFFILIFCLLWFEQPQELLDYYANRLSDKSLYLTESLTEGR